MANDTILEMKNIVKIYPGVVALNNVSFEVRRGEVHAVVGENGAGKSTLIKVLAGSVGKNAGIIYIDGNKYKHYTPAQAIDMGISIIYQEFNLVPQLTVEENIFLGREIKKRVFLNKKEMLKKALSIIEQLGVYIDPKQQLKSLSIALQQLIEIAKAIYGDAKIIVMDEPTATLSTKELQTLFQLIRRLRERGKSVIYISHRLEEIFEIADRVTVMRDGEHVTTMNVKETSRKELIKLMVGRELTDSYPVRRKNCVEDILEVRNLSTVKVRNINFSLKKGEILGIAGLVGAGRTELARALFGLDKYTGDIILNGSKIHINSPMDAIKHRIGLLPEDRKLEGLILKMSVGENISFSVLDDLSTMGFLNKKKEKKLVRAFVKKMSIKAVSLDQKVLNLSGGNQQKVVLVKWLATNSDILIFDEPTRGIDVGAKQEIYHLMTDLVKEGKSIIMISSELPELLGMSDRIAVMHRGEISGIVNTEEANQELLLELASGEGGGKD